MQTQRHAPTVSVVVCAYTMARWTLLVRALSSVRAQTWPALEILLVVDHCPELLVRAPELGEGVRVLANGGPVGLSGARNTGVAEARGEVVAFLDDDAAAAPDWLEHLLRPYDDPHVVGVGGRVIAEWEGGRPAWFPQEYDWVVGCSYVGQPTVVSAVRNPIGANMSFRREALRAVGGFSVEVGRVGARPVGCEETELSIRVTRRHPASVIVLEPRAVVRHHVSRDRSRWGYFWRRCWAEGRSKATVTRLTDPRAALATERSYVLRTLPRGAAHGLADAVRGGEPSGAARALAITAGLTVTASGYLTGMAGGAAGSSQPTPRRNGMSAMTDPDWVNFDIHGRAGVRVRAQAPAALQLKTMMGSFAVDRQVSADIAVSADHELMVDAAVLEDELAYTDSAVEFKRHHVQVVEEGDGYRVNGSGELLTTVLPLLDLVMVKRRAAMIHAATVGYQGRAIAMPAAGGTGKTSTIAKLMKRPGFSFMGDDWAFVTEDGRLLNYEKPMFIKPHHRPIYPHLFQGSRKPLVPVRLSRPLGRLTTVVHPHIVKYPRLADMSRRLSPEHRIVTAQQALPGVSVTREAPLLMAVFVERYEGARTRVTELDAEWMVQRMLGNFNIEMPGFSRDVLAGLAATSHLSLGSYFSEKAAVLTAALAGVRCFVMRVPSVYTPDVASDDIVDEVERLIGELVGENTPPPGVNVA